MPDPTPEEAAAALQTELTALKLNLSTLTSSLATEKTAREAAEAEKTRLEREKLTEQERVSLELADVKKKAEALDPLRNELGQYETAFKTLYDTELAAVPEAQRAAVELLSKGGKWPERVDALRAAKALAGVAPAAAPMGSALAPGAGGGGDVTKPYTMETAPRVSDLTFKR